MLSSLRDLVPLIRDSQTLVLALATALNAVNVGHECSVVPRVQTNGSGDPVLRLHIKLRF